MVPRAQFCGGSRGGCDGEFGGQRWAGKYRGRVRKSCLFWSVPVSVPLSLCPPVSIIVKRSRQTQARASKLISVPKRVAASSSETAPVDNVLYSMKPLLKDADRE